MLVTPEQVRAARALMRMDQVELARRVRVSVVTIGRLEAVEGGARPGEGGLEGVRHALEQAGVEFIADGVQRRHDPGDDAGLYDDLRAISLRSAANIAAHERMSDAELYDDDGLPA
jgi:transcriptional regulator with XRE-family HTH domain